MKRTLAVILALALILFALALGLSGLARRNAQAAHVALMETLLPGGTDFVRLTYAGEDKTIRSVHKAQNGFVIETVTQGYADEVVVLVAVTNAGKVTGLVTAEAHETPGLGSRILTDHAYLAQFLNRSGSFTVGTPASSDAFSGATAEQSNTDDAIAVDGISGATVSSKAVARCVSAAVAYVSGADVSSSATEWGG